jgi:cullin-4
MRKGQGKGTEAEFDALLEEIIALIGFTRDKDVFKAFYSTQLAKRLLLNKSASDDMERNMIVKLQQGKLKHTMYSPVRSADVRRNGRGIHVG